MKKIRLFISFIFLFLLAGNVYADSYAGHIKNGRYYSVDNQLSVNLPDIPGVSVRDSKNAKVTSVDFVSPHLYYGEYLIDLVKNKEETAKNFSIFLKPMKSMIKETYHIDLKIQSCQYIRIHNSKAYQCVGNFLDGRTPSIFVGTSVFVNGQLVIIYGQNMTEHGFKSEFAWSIYNNMINSIRVLS